MTTEAARQAAREYYEKICSPAWMFAQTQFSLATTAAEWSEILQNALAEHLDTFATSQVAAAVAAERERREAAERTIQALNKENDKLRELACEVRR